MPSTDFLASYNLDMSEAFRHVLDTQKILTSITEPLREMQQSIASSVAAHASSLGELYKPILADITAVNYAFSSLASSDVFQKLRAELEEDEDTVKAFNASGWPISPSMPPSLKDSVRQLHSQGRTRYVSAKIIGHFKRNGHQALQSMVDSWATHPLFKSRVHIIREALRAHVEKRYTLSVPALLPQVEGVLIEYVVQNGIDVKLGKIQDVYERVIGDPLDYDMSTWVVASTLLYQLQTSTYLFSDFRSEVTKSINTRTVSRHTVLHGIAIRYDSAGNSLRAFLLLDALSTLKQLPNGKPA
jgi:hypothetical protein